MNKNIPFLKHEAMRPLDKKISFRYSMKIRGEALIFSRTRSEKRRGAQVPFFKFGGYIALFAEASKKSATLLCAMRSFSRSLI
jgi:hypothetical protein